MSKKQTARKKSVTMQDIANETGVSITTVSHVINKTRHVNSETRSLVLDAMNRLEYSTRKPENAPPLPKVYSVLSWPTSAKTITWRW